jgi:hypothetical protein
MSGKSLKPAPGKAFGGYNVLVEAAIFANMEAKRRTPHVMNLQVCRRIPEMKDADQLLREKEAQLNAIRREVEALRIVAPLLIDEDETMAKKLPQSERATGVSRYYWLGGEKSY